MASLSAAGSWFAALFVLFAVLCIGWVAVAILNRILDSPGRTVTVGIRVLPWPRIEIHFTF
ncbi:hypothetical protein, partial [Nocardia salmonicida]|uniref:hypothetical protein n=1 Tax=Nocardia salmonicida TaxID=53431 RepID=UPI0036467D2A